MWGTIFLVVGAAQLLTAFLIFRGSVVGLAARHHARGAQRGARPAVARRVSHLVARHPRARRGGDLRPHRPRRRPPPPPAETLGDRLEHAIEQRTDVAAEIEQAEPRPPHRRGPSSGSASPASRSISCSRRSSRCSARGATSRASRSARWWRWPRCSSRRSRACGRCSTSRCRRRRWRPVITSQLAGNALAKVAPGGGALGAALQYRMLVQAGLPPAATVSALTAVNLLVFAVVLALPVLAIPALLRGAVDRTLLETAVVGPGDLLRGLRARRRCCSRPTGPLAVGRAPDPARAQPAPPQGRAAAPPARAAAARARPHPADARPALEARAAGDRRALDVRLPDAAGGAGGDRLAPAAGARAARVLRRPGAGADPGHAGRPGLRRGGPDRDARARRRLARATRCWRRSPTACSPTGCRCRSASAPSRCTRARAAQRPADDSRRRSRARSTASRRRATSSLR